MAALNFELRSRRGLQRVEIDADLVRVGSAAHCELRLPLGEAAPEQLCIERRSTGLFGRVRALEPRVRLDGAAFSDGKLPNGASLTWGEVELRVHTEEARRAPRPGAGRSFSSTPMYAAVATLVVLLLMILIGAGRLASSHETVPPLPPLFSADEQYTCPQKEPSAARSFAEREWPRAKVAEARAPFAIADGMLAVELFRRVQACLLVAGDSGRAASAGAAADVVAGKLSAEFRAHQIALDRALALRRYEDVRFQLSALSPYLRARKDSYAEQLRVLARQIDLQLSKQE